LAFFLSRFLGHTVVAFRDIVSSYLMFEVPFEKLGRFAGNLATCLEAGVAVEQALKSSKRSLSQTRFGGAIEVAEIRVRQGASLHDALATEAAPWPRFFLPILGAGEQAGRTDEALRFLERHCKLLAKPANAIRNAWLAPLVIMLFGTTIKLGICVAMLPLTRFFATAIEELRGYATLALIAIVLVARPFRPLIDPIKLAIPWIGAAERELAMNRFFQVLAMMYATGGRRVDSMIRFSAICISNVAVRQDLLQAAAQIEQGESLPQAFEEVRYVTPSEKEVIATGDLSGTLERAFERINFETGEKLTYRMEMITLVATRITMVLVMGMMVRLVFAFSSR
jgi:type IV pilus assembly protein PilC